MNEHRFTTKEFIKYLEEKEGIVVRERTLRFYVSNGIFPRPAKIGGNRGYYSLKDIPKLKTIRLLQSFGKSIKEIKDALASGVPITEEGFAELQAQVINRISSLLVDDIQKIVSTSSKLYKNQISLLNRAMKNIEYYDSKAGEQTKYYGFALKLEALLKRCPYILPNDWGIKQVTSLLGASATPTGGVSLRHIRKKPGSRYGKEAYYVDSNRETLSKNETKQRVKNLINKRIKELSSLLTYIESLD